MRSRSGSEKWPLGCMGPRRPQGWSLSSSGLTFTHRTLLSHQGRHCCYTTNQNTTKPALLLGVFSTPGFNDPTKGWWLIKGKSKCQENLLWGRNLISSLFKEQRNVFLEETFPQWPPFLSSKSWPAPTSGLLLCYFLYLEGSSPRN